MRTSLLFTTVVFVASTNASAVAISDTFESYAPGTFPSPTWLDVATVFNSGQIIPSASIVTTTDAQGNPTQAVAIRDQLGSSRGIYAPTAIGRFYALQADIRPDRYTPDSLFPTTDWAMQLTFANSTVSSFNGTPQAGIYASSLTRGWRLFLIGEVSSILDVDLGVAANLDTWYTVSLDADALLGTFRSRIFDTATGNLLVDNTTTATGWTPAEANWNSIAFFGGDLSGTVANQAVVDNVNVTSSGTIPEPSSLAMFGAAGLALIGARRRKQNGRNG